MTNKAAMNNLVHTALVSVGEIPSSGIAGHKIGDYLPLLDTVTSDFISLCVVLLTSSQHQFCFKHIEVTSVPNPLDWWGRGRRY